jgi:hypothetical protein
MLPPAAQIKGKLIASWRRKDYRGAMKTDKYLKMK